MSWTDTKQELSWAYQAADMDAIDPIVDGNALNWYWGTHIIPGEMPIEDHEFVPIYYSSRDPAELVLIKSKVQSSIGFVPSNAIPWYMFLGSSVTDGTPEHVISGLDTGNIETICARQESYGTVNKYWTNLDNKLQTLTFAHDLRNKGSPAAMVVGLIGVNSGVATYNTHYAPKFPTTDGTMGGTQLVKPYLRDANTSFIWDQGGTPVEYIDALQSFTYQGTNAFQPHYKQNQAELEWIFEGNRTHRVNFEIKMGKDSSIYDDFRAGTLHNVRYKVYNTATLFQQLDITGVGLSKPTPTFEQDQDKRVFACVGMAKSIQVTAQDGITQAGSNVFYGESN